MLSARHNHIPPVPRPTLTIFFADKEQVLSGSTSNIAVLAVAAQHAAGMPDAKGELSSTDSSVLAFDGRAGTDDQHQVAIQAVQQLFQGRRPLTLNCCGAGSGAISALRLAACLAEVPQAVLEINLLLIDPALEAPAPSFFSVFSVSPAELIPDVSGNRNLTRVLSLYAASRSEHSPVFPEYPAQCVVAEEVCPGVHAEIQQMDQEAGKLAYLRSLLFLKECGAIFSASISFGGRLFHADRDVQALAADLTDTYSFFVDLAEETDTQNWRQGVGRRRTSVVTESSGGYLNIHHRALAAGSDRQGACLYSIKKASRWPWLLSRMLFWLLAGVAVIIVLQFTGVLALMPFLAAMPPLAGVATVGGLSILSPILWYGMLKPLARLVGQYLTPASSCRVCRPVTPGGTYGCHFFGRGLLREGAVSHFPDPEAGPVLAQIRTDCSGGPQDGRVLQANRSLRRV